MAYEHELKNDILTKRPKWHMNMNESLRLKKDLLTKLEDLSQLQENLVR